MLANVQHVEGVGAVCGALSSGEEGKAVALLDELISEREAVASSDSGDAWLEMGDDDFDFGILIASYMELDCLPSSSM